MATVKAYLTKYSAHRAHDLGALSEQDLAEAVFVTPYPCEDWTEVGSVEMTVHLYPRADVVASQIAAMRKEQADNNAAAIKRNTELERAIQSLLAIEHTAAA